MPSKVLPEYEGRESNYYDRMTGRTCLIIKAVDITDACPGRKPNEQVRLEYIQDSNGMKVIIQNCYPDKDYGRFPIFSIDQLSSSRDQDRQFSSLGKDFGLTPDQLLALVQECAPPRQTGPVIGQKPTCTLL